MKYDLEERTAKFGENVIDLLKKVRSSTVNDSLIRQIIRSATSIGANYIEAQASSSKKDFTNFFHHSLKSANETKFWLAILRDTGKCEEKKADELLKELTEIANILGASILTLKGK